MTLAELMVAAGVMMVIGTGLAMGLTALQKIFTASIDYASDHGSEMRISDYIARDLRSATSVTVTGFGGGTVISMAVPNFYDSMGNPRTPTLNGNGAITYQDTSTPPVASGTISYYLSNGSMYRASNGTPKVLATSVQNFQLYIIDSVTAANSGTTFNLAAPLIGKVAEVKTQISFSPVFSAYGSTAGGAKSTTFYNTTLMRNARSTGTSSISLY